ncbi:MAG TPA: hypothetical protein VLZ83_11140 [Edaphocola sp.]|nr:hypothetical protein [Edaphocola sp.]
MKIKSTIILLNLLLYGCGFGTTEWSIEKLYVQKIEGTSKVIYNFSAWGGFDSNPHGFIVLDSTKSFKVDVENILPIYNLSNIPKKDKIEGVSHDCFGTCGENYYKSTPLYKPMKTEESESNGLKITNRIYQYRGYSEREGGLERYTFEKFTETKDSLYFYKLEDVESMEGIKLEELKVKKGEIYLNLDKHGAVKKIIIEQRDLATNSKEFIEGSTFFLIPKNKIFENDFSERGIFREIIINK